MDEALLNGEVWVAWDHSARLLQAFKERPDEFVAFPAPIGPKGRGLISVLAGLGVPKGSVSGRSEELIDYLTRPDVQVKTMESVGFLPVVRISNRVDLPDGLRVLLQAAVAQLSSPEAILSSVPLLGGDAGRSFNLAYMVAFSRIVLRGLPIDAVLAVQESKLREAVTPIRMSPSELRGH
jgi:multiple sugar transport system substrate-binding protein